MDHRKGKIREDEMKKTICMMCVVLAMAGAGAYGQQPSGAPSDPLSENTAKLKSKDASVRRQAVENMGAMRNNPAVIEPLRQALKDPSPFVRSSALDSLGLQRATPATKDIVNLLLKDPEGSVRQSAAVALNYIGDQSAVPALIQALKDSNDGTRFAAANTLGSLRSAAAIPALVEGTKDKNAGMRHSCLNALGRIENKSSLPALRSLFKDEDAYMRAESIRIGGALQDKESDPAFKDALKDQDKKVRLAAAGALAPIFSSKWETACSPSASQTSGGTNSFTIKCLRDIIRCSFTFYQWHIRQMLLRLKPKRKFSNRGANPTFEFLQAYPL
jgi:HEAT repeat protein